MIFNQKISERTIRKYIDDAIAAALDMGIIINFNSGFIKQIDKLCVMLHDDINYISNQEILLDSIAIKNTALVYEYLRQKYPSENIVWYRNDKYYGKNTYPINFRGLMIFPKEWIKESIVSGAYGAFTGKFNDAIKTA